MEHDYDEKYDTKISRLYGRSRAGFAFGSIVMLIGAIDIIISICEMYTTQFNLGQVQTDTSLVYTWDENPFWPSYGKGFWVGLILMATGISGIVSSLEHTLTSIYAFAGLSTISAVFSFYLMITAIIPISKYSDLGNVAVINLGNVYLNSMTYNSILLSLGALGFIINSLAGFITCLLVGLCSERRGYGGQFVENYYKSVPANIPVNRRVDFGATNVGFTSF